MARFRQVAGSILVGVVTLAVAVAAAYALWLGAPLLSPAGGGFDASDIPLINTDARILVPIPEQTQVSPRAGVIRPTPPAAKPKPQKAVNKSPSKRRSVKKATREVARSTKPRSNPKIVLTSHESDDDERRTRSEDLERSKSSERSDSSDGESSDDDSSKSESSKSESSKSESSKGESSKGESD